MSSFTVTYTSVYYVPGSEELEQASPSPDYVPEPDPIFGLCCRLRSGGGLEEGPIDYAADADDDEQEEGDESFKDENKEGEESFEDDDDEEEEHLAPADSIFVASLSLDHVPSAEETESFKTDELLALPILPPSPLTLLSSPLPQIPPPPTSPTYVERARFTAPTSRFEVEESAAAARQSRSTVACRVEYSFVDTVDANIRDFKKRTMVAIKVVNLRVSYHADVRRQQGEEFYTRHQDDQEDRAALRDEVDTLRRAIMRIQELKAGACVNTLDDTGSSA
nr:hypothetical protein [Tanacetum cinerariifolium]